MVFPLRKLNSASSLMEHLATVVSSDSSHWCISKHIYHNITHVLDYYLSYKYENKA